MYKKSAKSKKPKRLAGGRRKVACTQTPLLHKNLNYLGTTYIVSAEADRLHAATDLPMYILEQQGKVKLTKVSKPGTWDVFRYDIVEPKRRPEATANSSAK